MITNLSRHLSKTTGGKFPILPKFQRTMQSATVTPGTMAQVRNYDLALAFLDSLQSNRSIVSTIQKSDRHVNYTAIPEMLDWIRKAGYAVEDFDRLKVVHVAG